jgi:hypothetical protein
MNPAQHMIFGLSAAMLGPATFGLYKERSVLNAIPRSSDRVNHKINLVIACTCGAVANEAARYIKAPLLPFLSIAFACSAHFFNHNRQYLEEQRQKQLQQDLFVNYSKMEEIIVK